MAPDGAALAQNLLTESFLAIEFLHLLRDADPSTLSSERVTAALQGRAVQVDPIKPTLKPPRYKRLKLKYDEPLLNFASNVNVRRYIKPHQTRFGDSRKSIAQWRLLGWQGLTLVHLST